MEAEGSLKRNLSHVQWKIISYVFLTEHFMTAQSLREAESCVAVSLTSTIIFTIRKGLHYLAVRPDSIGQRFFQGGGYTLL